MAVKTNYEKNGNNYFRVTATIGRKSDGKPIKKEFYGKSKKEAERKKDEYLNNLKSGLNLDFDKITVGNLFHIWLFEIIKVSNKIKPSTFERYESVYRNYIKNSEISNILIAEIKSMQIQKFYNNLYKNGKTSASIEVLDRLLKSYFNYAVDENYIIKNPISKKITIPGAATKNKSS